MLKNEDLRYKRNNEIRSEIADMAGIETDRYENADSRFTKSHLKKIAKSIQPNYTVEDMKLRELLVYVCVISDTEYQPTSGRQYGLRRENLKSIYETLSRTIRLY
jgi:hypothetical protein